jgi:hypothetical protein
MDIKDYIDIEKIRNLLINEPDMLSLFELVLIIINQRINIQRHPKAI